jgi:imidazole glycerol phosphate synthase subunit HisF
VGSRVSERTFDVEIEICLRVHVPIEAASIANAVAKGEEKLRNSATQYALLQSIFKSRNNQLNDTESCVIGAIDREAGKMYR